MFNAVLFSSFFAIYSDLFCLAAPGTSLNIPLNLNQSNQHLQIEHQQEHQHQQHQHQQQQFQQQQQQAQLYQVSELEALLQPQNFQQAHYHPPMEAALQSDVYYRQHEPINYIVSNEQPAIDPTLISPAQARFPEIPQQEDQYQFLWRQHQPQTFVEHQQLQHQTQPYMGMLFSGPYNTDAFNIYPTFPEVNVNTEDSTSSMPAVMEGEASVYQPMGLETTPRPWPGDPMSQCPKSPVPMHLIRMEPSQTDIQSQEQSGEDQSDWLIPHQTSSWKSQN